MTTDINYEVQVASVIPQTVDATLSTRGVAADAKAVGDALAGKANRDELPPEMSVNGVSPDESGNITINAGDIDNGGNTVAADIDEIKDNIVSIGQDITDLKNRRSIVAKTIKVDNLSGLEPGAGAYARVDNVNLGTNNAIITGAMSNHNYYACYNPSITKNDDGTYNFSVSYGNPTVNDYTSRTATVYISVLGW